MIVRALVGALASLLLVAPAAVAKIGLGQPAGCVLQLRNRPPSCGPGFGLLGVTAVAVNPDGSGVYAAAQESYAVAALARDSTTGLLRWTSCVSDDGTDGTFAGDGRCRDGDALRGASDVDVSADGQHVYVTSARAAAVATLRRDPISGALTPAGCVVNVGPVGHCGDVAAMRAPRQLALSPDGRFAYVAASSSGAIDVFARDAVTGALGWESCISNNGTDGTCVDGAALRGPWGVAVSPDGGNVYVAARTSGAVVIFARDAATGGLRQTGCVLHLAPVGVCVPTQSLRGVSALAVSADGSTLIAAGTTGVVAFARDSTTGALRQTGCLGDTGCPPLTTVNHPSAVLVAPDGARALVADRGAGTVTLLQNGATGLRELSCLRGRLSYGPGRCAPLDGLDGASAVAASPDGRFVYAGAARGVLSLPEGAGW